MGGQTELPVRRSPLLSSSQPLSCVASPPPCSFRSKGRERQSHPFKATESLRGREAGPGSGSPQGPWSRTEFSPRLCCFPALGPEASHLPTLPGFSSLGNDRSHGHYLELLERLNELVCKPLRTALGLTQMRPNQQHNSIIRLKISPSQVSRSLQGENKSSPLGLSWQALPILLSLSLANICDAGDVG